MKILKHLYYDFLDDIVYMVSVFFRPKNVLKIKTISKYGESNPTTLIHAMFQVLVNSVEKRKVLEYYSESIEDFKFALEKSPDGFYQEYINRYTDAKDKLELLYQYWTVDRVKEDEEIEDLCMKTDIDDIYDDFIDNKMRAAEDKMKAMAQQLVDVYLYL